jgi:hypothetical protein
MTLLRKIIHPVLIVFTGLLALSAFGGGLALIFNWNAPPVEQLGNSIFKNFLLPGLSLFLLVGGSALLAMILLIRRSKYALLFANTAGIIIMFFEFVEVMIIGSPEGAARPLQIFYFGLGTLITVFATVIWFIDLRTQE